MAAFLALLLATPALAEPTDLAPEDAALSLVVGLASVAAPLLAGAAGTGIWLWRNLRRITHTLWRHPGAQCDVAPDRGGGRPVFEVGRVCTIRMFDQDGGNAAYKGCGVVAHERPVVKFPHAGEAWIINTHIWAFFDARPESHGWVDRMRRLRIVFVRFLVRLKGFQFGVGFIELR